MEKHTEQRSTHISRDFVFIVTAYLAADESINTDQAMNKDLRPVTFTIYYRESPLKYL